MERYVVGVDYGTASVRAVVVSVDDGNEVASEVYKYRAGVDGCLSDSRDPLIARQVPSDYVGGLEFSVRGAVEKAARAGVACGNIIGIGVDTTGSTIMPVLRDGTPLVETVEFKDKLAAHIWLWKDHSAWQEAELITEIGKKLRPEYLKMVGEKYSSEWFWSKVLHCLNTEPEVYHAAYTWVEISDWIIARLSGQDDMSSVARGVCAAGHKALYNQEWGGYPDEKFISELHPELSGLLETLNHSAVMAADRKGGVLCEAWAEKLGLKPGIAVAMPAFDAHFGGIGGGIRPGVLVKTIGTSTCDLMISSAKPDIPGVAGIVKDSIIPGYYGIEAGQSGVGDIFNWFEKYIAPSGRTQAELTTEAEELRPGESGLLALDWHNGNRTILVDQRLSGLVLGLTLHSTAAEIYRALVEATAFGARVIHEQLEGRGINIDKIIVCGGIPRKSPFLMQIYADVFNMDLYISANLETCALGGAVSAAVVAGAYDDFVSAIDSMTGVAETVYHPRPENVKIYDKLYVLYRMLHDAFGPNSADDNLSMVMKELIDIRSSIRA